MTENSRLVFEYFKKHPTRKYTKRNLIDNLDMTMPTVNASILAFLKKGSIIKLPNVVWLAIQMKKKDRKSVSDQFVEPQIVKLGSEKRQKEQKLILYRNYFLKL